MASWQMRCMKTKTGQKPNKKLSIFLLFFVFPQINKECSTETGVEGET